MITKLLPEYICNLECVYNQELCIWTLHKNEIMHGKLVVEQSASFLSP